jgi:hemolysin activation/secretion protein
MNRASLFSTSALLCTVLPALAQQGAAERPLQENAPRVLPAPAPVKPLPFTPAQPANTPATPVGKVEGAVSVQVNRIAFEGNSAIGGPALLAALGPVTGASYDFAGLTGLAAKVTAYYQSHGYPFARAYLPRQQVEAGVLRIAVLEGRYGRVVAQGAPEFREAAQGFLASLAPGALIESSRLERATLILDDQPGVKTVPVIRPGKELGTGDLLVEVQRGHRYAGEVGIDNLGSIYTGRTRVHANLDIDSPFVLGDQVSLQALTTDRQMWFGAAAYSTPLGASGLRARVGVAHSYYALADNFSALDASGTADVGSAFLTYPLIRSQPRNLTLSAGYEHKRLNDRQDTVGSASRKHTDTLPLTANFDARDNVLDGAVTYGALSLTTGRLHLDATVLDLDGATARTQGSFSRLNLDLARIQAVAGGLDLYGRVSGQWANKNLDSSQKFGLGGKNGVRAYPSGEGYGDQGGFAQAEVRYAAGMAAPYLFYDIGRVTINHRSWAAGESSRLLSGTGAGVRFLNGKVKGELIVAWRRQGGLPRSDTRTAKPTVWASLD